MSSKEKINQNRSYRYKSGTKALRNVRKEMRSTESIIPSATFKNILKSILGYLIKDRDMPRFQKIYLEFFQAFVENKLIDIISKSLKVCIHDGERITVKDIDILLILDLFNYNSNQVKYIDPNIVPENPLRKLSYRAGSKRISKDAIQILKSTLINICREILEKSLLYMEHKRNRTLQLSDVKDAIRILYNEEVY